MFGCLRAGYINDVDTAASQGRKNQLVSDFGGIIITARAGIPPRMVQLIANIKHGQSVDHLQIPYIHGKSKTRVISY